MINRKTLGFLAAATFVLVIANGIIGSGNDVLWVLDDILFFGLMISVLALVVLTVAVLAKSVRRTNSSS